MKTRDIHRQKLEHMLKKRDKLAMIEALICQHELTDPIDYQYIGDLKRRANELRNQLHVSSTAIIGYEF